VGYYSISRCIAKSWIWVKYRKKYIVQWYKCCFFIGQFEFGVYNIMLYMWFTGINYYKLAVWHKIILYLKFKLSNQKTTFVPRDCDFLRYFTFMINSWFRNAAWDTIISHGRSTVGYYSISRSRVTRGHHAQPRSQALPSCGGKTLVRAGHVSRRFCVVNWNWSQGGVIKNTLLNLFGYHSFAFKGRGWMAI
jgi:hypothetical protein